MSLSRLNLLTAMISLLASFVWLASGHVADGLFWLACSVVWLALAVARLRSPGDEPRPLARLLRRVSRMLLWG